MPPLLSLAPNASPPPTSSQSFEGESKLEREVRIQWIYTCDGPMMLAFLADLAYLFYYWYYGDLGLNNDTLSLLFSMGLCVGYIAGNVQLAHAMQVSHLPRSSA